MLDMNCSYIVASHILLEIEVGKDVEFVTVFINVVVAGDCSLVIIKFKSQICDQSLLKGRLSLGHCKRSLQGDFRATFKLRVTCLTWKLMLRHLFIINWFGHS